MLAMSDHSFLKALLLELDLIIYLQCVKIFFLVKTTYHLPDEEHLLFVCLFVCLLILLTLEGSLQEWINNQIQFNKKYTRDINVNMISRALQHACFRDMQKREKEEKKRKQKEQHKCTR